MSWQRNGARTSTHTFYRPFLTSKACSSCASRQTPPQIQMNPDPEKQARMETKNVKFWCYVSNQFWPDSFPTIAEFSPSRLSAQEQRGKSIWGTIWTIRKCFCSQLRALQQKSISKKSKVNKFQTRWRPLDCGPRASQTTRGRRQLSGRDQTHVSCTNQDWG